MKDRRRFRKWQKERKLNAEEYEGKQWRETGKRKSKRVDNCGKYDTWKGVQKTVLVVKGTNKQHTNIARTKKRK